MKQFAPLSQISKRMSCQQNNSVSLASERVEFTEWAYKTLSLIVLCSHMKLTWVWMVLVNRLDDSTGVKKLLFWSHRNKCIPTDEDFENEKEKYFSRIALDFGILLISATEDIKETFLKIFPEFLAMVLYSLYFKAFPDSRKSFGPEFKQKLVNISHMWLTGLAPLPNSFQSWPMEVLENSKEDSTENLGSTDKTSTKTIKPQTGMLSNFVYTKSLFDPKGCSPLIHRFLQLHDIEPVRTERGRCVTHTDVTEQRSKAASEALANRARRREQFEEVARRQDEEILQLAGERRRLEARFERLQRQLGDLDDTSVMDMRLLVAEYAREGLEEQEPDDGT